MNKDLYSEAAANYSTERATEKKAAHAMAYGADSSQVSRIRSGRPPRGNPNIAGTSRIRQVADIEDRNEKADAEARAYALAQLGAELYTLRPVVVALFTQLQSIVYRAMQTNGFWDGDQRNFAAKTALVHSELSEMLEANRKAIEHDDKVPQYTGEEAEAADTLIRMLDLGGGFELRLGEALVDKMLANLARPFRHGKAY